jgi:uncharacterized protein YcbX
VLRLVGITLYPIKSLDGVGVPDATILSGGALSGDREYSMWDQQGQIVNGKREPKVHRLRLTFDRARGAISLIADGGARPAVFRLPDETRALEAWLSGYFHYPIVLKRDTHTGFPDDPTASGPTVVSTASLSEVASWFPGLDPRVVRRRFRANLEIEAAEGERALPFWEDRLAAADGRPVRFHIGDVIIEGQHLCPRCAVPSRDPLTGEEVAGFQRIFSERRRATLPTWAPEPLFDHFYYLTVSTRVPASETGKTLRVGDEVRL